MAGPVRRARVKACQNSCVSSRAAPLQIRRMFGSQAVIHLAYLAMTVRSIRNMVRPMSRMVCLFGSLEQPKVMKARQMKTLLNEVVIHVVLLKKRLSLGSRGRERPHRRRHPMKPPPLTAQLEDGHLREPRERLCDIDRRFVHVSERAAFRCDSGERPRWASMM